MKKTMVVMGATGQIGHALTQDLLSQNHRVIALGRNPEKLAALKSHGAEIVSMSFDDSAALTTAFKGADAVFSLIPPDYGAANFSASQDKTGLAIASAIQKSGVKKVVNLSSFGAQHEKGTGPITGLYRHEQRLNTLGIDVLHLRAGYFMENFYNSIPTIKNLGRIMGAIQSHLDIWFVATSDIAAKAAAFLDEGEFRGNTIFEFGGPRPLSQAEAAFILGQAIGKPGLCYAEMPYSDFEKALTGSGMPSGLAALFVEMHKALNDGLVIHTQEMIGDHIGSTSLEDFAQNFAQIYTKH